MVGISVAYGMESVENADLDAESAGIPTVINYSCGFIFTAGRRPRMFCSDNCHFG